MIPDAEQAVKKQTSKLRRFLNSLGPGFITGASDDDPSGIATYSQTGAQFGYSQLWTAPFSFPFMTAVQEMCGRVGMVTGKGLSGVIRIHYSKSVLYFAVLILLIANTVNIGADLGAMASALNLLTGVSFIYWLVAVTILSVVLQVFIPYKKYSNVLKYLTFSLFAYIATVFIVHQDWRAIAIATIVPSISLNKDYLLNIVAILGTTISPYLFFWQSNEEVEEEVESGKIRDLDVGTPTVTARDIRGMRLDTMIGMFFSNLVMFFIIATTASTLFKNGITNIETASQAAEALRPFAGDMAFLLFTLGIVGTGLLAVPVLAGASAYGVTEAIGKKVGLSKKYNQVPFFYGVIAVSTLAGLFINFTGIPPFKMLYYTAILNGVCAPPLLILIMLISNNKKILGNRTNNLLSNSLGWIITAIMTLCALALLWTLVS
jgi:NRAMP (natural resistance-associated macrophage protein)-like metal ion transporter